ncbi:hypothetical protein GQX74_004355 [Glossina fuscipes]|uniref:Uncharacterized protein n=1 Tax=Glossina palpalis gambiensis TaxID=67801 RepID=A0A1B0BAD1_9MUSC|nr:hypothetical protein GQX74_004355 [Glossina fuscipes]
MRPDEGVVCCPVRDCKLEPLRCMVVELPPAVCEGIKSSSRSSMVDVVDGGISLVFESESSCLRLTADKLVVALFKDQSLSCSVAWAVSEFGELAAELEAFDPPAETHCFT